MTKKIFYKTATLAMTISILAGSTSFASTQPLGTTSNNKTSSTLCSKNDMGSLNFKSKLDGLVTAGTITQVQEDAALKLTPTKGFKNVHNEIKVKLNCLVKAGTITKAQEDAIAKLAATTLATAKVNMKTGLDALVTEKTITQAQEDAVIKLATTNYHKGFKKGNNEIKVNLDCLFKAGTITKAQEDAIVKLAVTTVTTAKVNAKTGLDDLVTAGTITQAQEDAVIKIATTTNHKCFNEEKMEQK